MKISGGTVHKIPSDLKKSLLDSKKSLVAWEDISELARNEFICWIEDAKKDDTRQKRIKRTIEDLSKGKRRPCCWIGCIHRTDKAISPSVQGILNKRKKNK